MPSLIDRLPTCEAWSEIEEVMRSLDDILSEKYSNAEGGEPDGGGPSKWVAMT